MQKIIPHLWFDKEAQEAADFYVSVFGGGEILNTTHYTQAGHEIHGMDAGTVLTVEFQIEGTRFVALNGGPHFTFTPAISFIVNCPTKEEVDELWGKLSEGGRALMPLDSYPFSERYGWIQDKYGLSWQLIFSEGAKGRKIVPSLLFVGDQYGKAKEAITFYASLFKDSKVGEVYQYGSDMEPDKEDAIMYAGFTLANQEFAAMDSAGEHAFTFNEAFSFLVNCETQEEVDYFWERLSAVPEAEQCGWLKDKYGVSWQIGPMALDEMLNDPDKEKANRVMEAMLKMKKLDIGKLKEAYEG